MNREILPHQSCQGRSYPPFSCKILMHSLKWSTMLSPKCKNQNQCPNPKNKSYVCLLAGFFFFLVSKHICLCTIFSKYNYTWTNFSTISKSTNFSFSSKCTLYTNFFFFFLGGEIPYHISSWSLKMPEYSRSCIIQRKLIYCIHLKERQVNQSNQI